MRHARGDYDHKEYQVGNECNECAFYIHVFVMKIDKQNVALKKPATEGRDFSLIQVSLYGAKSTPMTGFLCFLRLCTIPAHREMNRVRCHPFQGVLVILSYRD